MATLSIVATSEPDHIPPRVRLDVTDSGTPAISSVTVTRTDGSGAVATVRTSDGNPLQLSGSTTRTGTIYDVEMPYGEPVTYSLAEQPSATATVTVNQGRPWLLDPRVPDRSLRVQVVDWGARVRKATQGVFYPLRRASAIVISDGARKSESGTLTVLTQTDQERLDMTDLLSDASVLLLNVPAALGWGVDSCYVSFGDVTENRVTRLSADPMRRWELPYVVTSSPIGGSQPQWTWSDVMDTYATWQDEINANATWLAVENWSGPQPTSRLYPSTLLYPSNTSYP